MCLILERQPNVSLDQKAFATACMNNPDGYGLVVPNGDGTCELFKELDYDVDELYNLIDQDFRDQAIMLHLRYTTVGETIRRNLHPFPILEFEKDGVDLWMAHNGTLSEWQHPWKDNMDWESDTRHFVRRFVRPLFKRLIKGMHIEDILTDPFVYLILDRELSAKSVLSFMDGYGNSLQVNALGNGGEYLDEGMWVSNMYSFDDTHRLPTTYSSYGNYGSGGSTYKSAFDKADEDFRKWYEEGKSSSSLNNTKHAEDTMQQTYCDMTGLDPSDIYSLTDDTLDYMMTEEPQLLKALAKELLERSYSAEAELESVKHKKEKAEKKIAELMKEKEDVSQAA